MDRRKGELFWKVLTLVVNLTFLLLATTIMTILLKNENYREDVFNYKIAFERFQEQTKRVNEGNLQYIEGRVNRLAENQDSTASTLGTRISVLEDKMAKLEKEAKNNKKNSTKIVNTNNNTVINGQDR